MHGYEGAPSSPSREGPAVRGALFLDNVVGVAGFEPTTTCTQGRCATRLRYTPNKWWSHGELNPASGDENPVS